MHGYLKVRPEKQNLELEELDLSDCEFIEARQPLYSEQFKLRICNL